MLYMQSASNTLQVSVKINESNGVKMSANMRVIQSCHPLLQYAHVALDGTSVVCKNE